MSESSEQDPGNEAPKIIVDSDWKSEAQAEKEKLAAEAEKTAGEAGGAGGAGRLPEPDFRGLVGMLATQAVMYMGGMADPSTGQAVFDPEYSRHMIDLLGVLETKTTGNLSEEEAQELGGVVRELRARYVELAQMVAKGQVAPGPAQDPGGATGLA